MKDCNFRIHKNKIGTGWVVAWNKLGISNSFTLETSFLGHSVGNDFDTDEFGFPEFIEIGEQIAKSIQIYLKIQKDLAYELKLNGGWLKPVVLNQVAGQPLAEIKAAEKEEAEKQKNKEKFLHEYAKMLQSKNKSLFGWVIEFKKNI